MPDDLLQQKPAALKEEEKQKLLEMSEISLWLDGYDDIFSDFDPRPYSKRALSIDFLSEAKRASRYSRPEKLELKLLVPKDKRSPTDEALISKRLREHFKRHHGMLKKDRRRVIEEGLVFVASGIILMFIATLILLTIEERVLVYTFLVVLLEPGGWFLFWEGLDLLVFKAKRIKPNLSFYEKMSKGDIQFLPY